MHTALRPWTTTGIALVGAGVIAVAPIAPVTSALEPVAVRTHAPTVYLSQVELTATVADILQFPAFRQYIINEVGDFLIQVGGLVEAGAGLGQVVAAIPETLVLLTQQLFSLDLLGALDTIGTALVGGFLTVALPIIESRALIEERNAAILGALATAGPTALLGAGAAIVGAINTVLEASIIGGQQVVDAVLTFDLGNIINAFVDATGDFFRSFGDAGQNLVDGIVFVQQTIAEALATQPPAAITSVPELDESNTFSLTAAEVQRSAFTASDTGDLSGIEQQPPQDPVDDGTGQVGDDDIGGDDDPEGDDQDPQGDGQDQQGDDDGDGDLGESDPGAPTAGDDDADDPNGEIGATDPSPNDTDTSTGGSGGDTDTGDNNDDGNDADAA